MLNQEIKKKISNLWEMFWAAGMTNPLTDLEQISYLLFMRRVEDVGLVSDDEHKWTVYTKQENTDLVSKMEEVFEYLKTVNNSHEPFTEAMRDSRFLITKPSLLYAAIDIIDEIYAEAENERKDGQHFQDTLGDFYELILSQTGEAGKNGQFRTPRHLIHFMCQLIEPKIEDTICDVTCGTSGFLVGAYQYIISSNSTETSTIDENGFEIRTTGNLIKPNSKKEKKLTTSTFYGYDVDTTMIRLGMMNLLMHNIREPHIRHVDTLSDAFDVKEKGKKFSKILANPPFTGRIDSLEISKELKRVYPPKYGKDGKREKQNIQSELLFLERIVQLLEDNGKAAVIVPEGVLFGGNKAYKNIREILLKDCALEAVISLPSGAFKPYTGVKTSVILFTKINENNNQYATEKVWFYELQNDGYSLDDNRRKLKENPLPVAVRAYQNRSQNTPLDKKRHFYVTRDEIIKNDLDLSYNRYKEFEYIEQSYDPPQEILKTLLALEEKIKQDMKDLQDFVG